MSVKNKIHKALFFCCLVASPTYATNYFPGFESTEHIAAGNHVKLYFTTHDTGTAGKALHLPNNLTLTYGDIVSMGDFYGIPDQPISSGQSDADRRVRFLAAFSMFAYNATAVTEMPKILAVIHQEQQALDDGVQRGEKPEDIYKKINTDDNRAWNCATGGGCSGMWWLQPGRYLELAKQDYDHFGQAAWFAYQAGHTLAINQALLAHRTQDSQQLEIAYAMNAFACHFLSDRFAAGHMRTPRSEIPASVTPPVIGALLASYMHTEENQYGLHVHNQRGDHWIAYGDRYYFDNRNTENRFLLDTILQESANQIFAAYQTGSPSTEEDLVPQLLPQPDENNINGNLDIAPMFYWDANKKQLFRRTNLSNPTTHQWTADWWGWTTLILLAQQYGTPIADQAALALSGYGTQAMAYGLITDKNIQQYIILNSAVKIT